MERNLPKNRKMNRTQLAKFMRESNLIAGENGLNPNDIHVARIAADTGFSHTQSLLEAHHMLTSHLNAVWSGRWRTVAVKVRSYLPPQPAFIPELMEEYMKKFKEMDACTASNEFEKIYPFQFFNGQMARLIWLSKRVKE